MANAISEEHRGAKGSVDRSVPYLRPGKWAGGEGGVRHRLGEDGVQTEGSVYKELLLTLQSALRYLPC